MWSFSGTIGHSNPSLAHGGGDAQGFQRTAYKASTHDSEPTWRNANDGGSGRACGNELPKTPDSRYMAQPSDEFFFPWEEGSVDNTIIIEQDDGFSEPRTPVSESPRQPPVMEARPVLRSIENLQNFSATRQLLFFEYFGCCLVFCNLISLHLVIWYKRDRKKEIRTSKILLKNCKGKVFQNLLKKIVKSN